MASTASSLRSDRRSTSTTARPQLFPTRGRPRSPWSPRGWPCRHLVHQRLLAVGARLRGHRRHRRPGPQRPHRLHRPGLPRPRVLPRRRRLLRVADPDADVTGWPLLVWLPAPRSSAASSAGSSAHSPCALRATTSPSSRWAWSSSASTSSRTGSRSPAARRHERGRAAEASGRSTSPSAASAADLHPQPGPLLSGLGPRRHHRRCSPRTSCAPARAARCRRSATGPRRRGHRREPGPLQGRRLRRLERAGGDRRRPLRRLPAVRQPDQWDLLLSIQYVAMIIVGGVGTVMGSILGALFIGALPAARRPLQRQDPVRGPDCERGAACRSAAQPDDLRTAHRLFLVFEPHGLAAVWRRVKTYFTTWPFSY